MAAEPECLPLATDSEDLEVPAAAPPRRRPAPWKLVAAAAAGVGLLGAAVAWRCGGGSGLARRPAAAPLGEFVREDSEEEGEEKAEDGDEKAKDGDEKAKDGGEKAKDADEKEKPKFHHRPQALNSEPVTFHHRPKALNSVPVTNATMKKMLKGSKFSSALKINEDGEINTYYLPGAKVVDDGMSVEYRPPYRFYLMKSDTTDYSKANNFYKPILPGKTFSVDMDFRGDNGPSCGCNINFYLVDMPVNAPGKDHDYYCDAQCFPDMGCCHEFDMNEGNEHVQQITDHACTGHYSQDSSWRCNKWGDPEVKITPPEFGKGSGNKIDGRKKFTFSQRFDVHGNDLTITTTISQGSQVLKKTMHSNGQMQNMLEKLQQGMAFVTGYWTAPDMNWMDGESCGSGTEHCSEEPAYISNWRITSNGEPVPSPNPSPSPSPGPDEPMTCGWCESGSCSGCNEETGWCSESESNCRQCGSKSRWCPKSKVTALGVTALATAEEPSPNPGPDVANAVTALGVTALATAEEPSPNPGPDEPMTCGWCESGSCGGCYEETGWCSESESNCRQCGSKNRWCPKSKVTA